MKFFAATALAVGSVASVMAADIDTTILQYALTLEHLEAFFYKQAISTFSASDFKKAGYPPYVRQRLIEVRDDEATHVAFLETALSGAGVTPTAACTYDFGYKTVDEFLAISRILEGVGVSAYLGAAALITEPDYLTAAAAILTVEARHQAEISTLTGQDGAPTPFDQPLTFSEVYSLAAPFITSCPSSNPKLPVTQFPALKVNTKKIVAGKRVSFHVPNGGKYIHLLNNLQDIALKLDNHGGIIWPSHITGRVYAVATTTAASPTDSSTVAGPALIEILNPSIGF